MRLERSKKLRDGDVERQIGEVGDGRTREKGRGV